MTNEEIKAAIQAKWGTIEQAAMSLDVARETLTKALNSEKPLREKYRVKLRLMGLDIPKNVTKSDDSSGDDDPGFFERMLEYLKKTYEEAKAERDENVADLRENINDLRENNESIRYTNREITDSHKTYRRMVDMCLDAGIIIPNVEKAVVKKH